MEKQSHFCKFTAERIVRPHVCHSGAEFGFPSPRLAYVQEGTCRCVSEDGELLIRAGDVWSLPAMREYRSFWEGAPGICFYYLEYESDFFSLSVRHFKKVEGLDLQASFARLVDSEDEYERLSLFYTILRRAAPFIAEREEVKIDPVLPALDHIRNHFDREIKVRELAEMCFMSQSKFYLAFKQIAGVSPIEYKNGLRIARASEMIRHGLTLERICEQLNYASPAFLRRQFKKYYGITPQELRKRHLAL